MKRREFSGLAATGMLAWFDVGAQPREYAPGRTFLVLDTPAPTQAPGSAIEVVSFFWYSCPHCNAFEPHLDAWIRRLPPDVHVRRVPVAFRPDFVAQQRLFHALETLGWVEQLHAKVFHEIHVRKNRIDRDGTILAWAQQQPGIDAQRFRDVYGSFGVANKVRRSTLLQEQYRVSGVPALGVAGRYYVDGATAGNMRRALAAVDELIERRRQNKG